MNFKEIISENNNKYDVYIGYNGRKEKIKINIKDKPSTIITGETGSGKSILLDQIMCQLIKNNDSSTMEFALIDTSGVELNYYSDALGRYCFMDTTMNTIEEQVEPNIAMRDKDKAQVILARVLEEMDRRRNIFEKNGYISVDEYNEDNKDNIIKDLVLVIDDNDSFISDDDEFICSALTAIIKECEDTNLFLFIATSNPHAKFFKTDHNLYASNRISLDLADPEESGLVNIDDAHRLTGTFKYDDKIYNTFDFEDSLIFDIINK